MRQGGFLLERTCGLAPSFVSQTAARIGLDDEPTGRKESMQEGKEGGKAHLCSLEPADGLGHGLHVLLLLLVLVDAHHDVVDLVQRVGEVVVVRMVSIRVIDQFLDISNISAKFSSFLSDFLTKGADALEGREDTCRCVA
jgi:hypothetical protein